MSKHAWLIFLSTELDVQQKFTQMLNEDRRITNITLFTARVVFLCITNDKHIFTANAEIISFAYLAELLYQDISHIEGLRNVIERTFCHKGRVRERA